jgi:hypothetical protein
MPPEVLTLADDRPPPLCAVMDSPGGLPGSILNPEQMSLIRDCVDGAVARGRELPGCESCAFTTVVHKV